MPNWETKVENGAQNNKQCNLIENYYEKSQVA